MYCLIITIILALTAFLLEFWTDAKYKKLEPAIIILFVIQLFVWENNSKNITDELFFCIGFNIWALIAVGLSIIEFVKGRINKKHES